MEKNEFKFNGVVGFISERATGTSKKGNDYQKGYIIVGEPEGNYPAELKVEWYREGASAQMDALQVGHHVTIEYKPTVSEYQDKHYQKIELRNLINHSVKVVDSEEPQSIGVNKYANLLAEIPKESMPF